MNNAPEIQPSTVKRQPSSVFDCAIIGGGLAGLTLAIQLANTGYSVVLFEKETYPYHKVCGEYISMESFNFLERLGVPLSEMNLPKITELLVSSPDSNFFQRQLDLGGFGISRYTLDNYLAQLAKRKGVKVLEGTKVTDVNFENDGFKIKTDKGDYKSKVACGTYGKRSVLDKKLGRNITPDKNEKNYVGVKYHIKLDFPSDRIELHNFKDGYCGISKVDGDRFCLCYLTDAQNLKNNANDIKTMERNVLMQNDFLKKYFTKAEFLYTEPLTISQVTFRKKSAVENHVLMLGDAAGAIAPLCGNGMSLAMRAAFEATPIIKNYLEGRITREILEKTYKKTWNNKFAFRIAVGRNIQHLFGKERMTNVAFRILNQMPFVIDKLIELTHGKTF